MLRAFLSFIVASLMWVSAALAVEVDLMWPKGTAFLDSNADPLGAGTLFIQDAGTNDHRTTYSDAAGTVPNTFTSNEIVLDSAGKLTESVYIPVGSWKFTLKDSSAATITTEDTIEGAHATSTFLTGSSTWVVPVISKTSAYTVVAADLGKCVNVNPTGGSFTLTLISAATAGDGKTLCVRHVGTANQATIATVSGQTISHFSTGGVNRHTWPLAKENESILLVSDGANWHAAATTWDLGQFLVPVEDDDLSAPPSSPTPGAWYIVDASPTGDWVAYSQYDLVQATGGGAWIKVTPQDGWLAYIRDEDLLKFYDGGQSLWQAIANADDTTASGITTYSVTYQLTDGTGGATPTADAWTKYPLNTEAAAVSGFSLASNVVTVPAGTYIVLASASVSLTESARFRWKRTDAAGTEILGETIDLQQTLAAGNAVVATVIGTFVATGSETYELQYYIDVASANGLGIASPEVGSVEHYGSVTLVDISSLKGETGDTGAQGGTGAAGLAGLQFNFDTETATGSDGDATDLRLNNATLASVTEIAFDDQDINSTDVSAYLVTIDDSDSTLRNTVLIQAPGTPADIAIYTISAACTDEAGWVRCPVAHVASNGTFSEDEDVAASFARTGDKGDTGSTGATGPTGPAIRYDFDTGTTLGTGLTDGEVQFNNAAFASVTAIGFEDNSAEAGNPDASAWVLSFDDVSNAGARGILYVAKRSAPENFTIYSVTGANTDNTTWVEVAVTHIASDGSFSAADALSVLFIPAGADGAGAPNAFATHNVPAGTDPVADAAADTLNWTAGAGVTITGDSSTDTITLAGVTASTTASGVVELATSAETITGTDTARAVTPAGLEAKVASATASGIVELSTDAEAITGTDTGRTVTPANLRAALELHTGASSIINGSLSWSVAANALTVALKTRAGTDPSASDPVYAWFRSATASSGVPVLRKITGALSVVISSGSTLGATSAEPFKLWAVLIDDAGTVVLGVINCLDVKNIYPLRETALISSTAEGGAGAADSAHVFYSTAAKTSDAIAIAGNATWSSGLTTAGTWDAGPSVAQQMGRGVALPGEYVGNDRWEDGFAESCNATTSFADSTVTDDITLTNAAHLIDASVEAGYYALSLANLTVQLLRGATVLVINNHYDSADTNSRGVGTLTFRDAPQATSAQTYKIQHKSGSANSVCFPRTTEGQSGGRMSLREIAN